MGQINYMPPLRTAVIGLVGLKSGYLTAETIAEVALVSPVRARAFFSILLANNVVKQKDDGFISGTKWDAWAARPIRSRPKASLSNSVSEIDKIKETIRYRVMEQIEKKRLTIYKLAKNIGIHDDYIYRIIQYGSMPPACHLILIARGLDVSIEELAGSK